MNAPLKDRLRRDLSTAMKARDAVTTGTLRMVLAAVQVEEVSGDAAHELTEDEVLAVVRREGKKRREAADAFDAAGRSEIADRERAEGAVLQDYLPTQLSEEDLTALVRAGLAESGATSVRNMGRAMKAVQALVAGRADGG
nr:GatB/YqeY domain-containing protein [Geodermatophilaceae bacterium]